MEERKKIPWKILFQELDHIFESHHSNCTSYLSISYLSQLESGWFKFLVWSQVSLLYFWFNLLLLTGAKFFLSSSGQGLSVLIYFLDYFYSFILVLWDHTSLFVSLSDGIQNFSYVLNNWCLSYGEFLSPFWFVLNTLMNCIWNCN